MAHAHCMLDTSGYKPTLIIYNTYCFSTATMVERTRLIVTLYVHCCLVVTEMECFDVLLTVHLSIILVINQLNAQNLVL